MEDEEVLFINHEQEQKLRKRVRKGAAEDRWVNIFQVVFPDFPKDQIPSPCKAASKTPPFQGAD